MADQLPQNPQQPAARTADEVVTSLLESNTRICDSLNSLINQLAHNAQHPAVVHAKVPAPSKNPMKEPEPFKGDAKELRRFLAYFTMWASLQGEPLNAEGKADEKAWMASALSFFRGDAAHWAQSYLQQVYDHDRATDKAAHVMPFGGTWAGFVEAAEARFRPGDDKEIAQLELDALKQGRGRASAYAASFLEIFPRTGLSQTDAMHRFKNGLNKEDRTWLQLSSLVKKPTTLLELCNQVISNEFEMKGSVDLTQRSTAPARDPWSMDIDATRTDSRPSNDRPGPNGYTVSDYRRKMTGHCFGCGSRSHSKAQCRVFGKEPCGYCKRNTHIEMVCQDKFMGYPCGRGANAGRNNARAQARATIQEVPFDICANESFAATPATPTSSTIAASSNFDIDRLERLQAQNFKLAEALTKLSKDF